MKIVNLNKLDSVNKYITNNKVKFDIEPLDMGIAKLQHTLLKKFESVVPEFGEFASYVESYVSKDPTLNISEIMVICKSLNDGDLKKNQRILELNIKDKVGSNTYNYVIAQGDKQNILSAIKSSKFFQICKSVSECVDEGLQL